MNSCLQSWPFDQQGNGFGQIFARFVRIGTFNEEGETGVIRRRRKMPLCRYGRNVALFKAFGSFEQVIHRLCHLGIMSGEAQQIVGVAADLVRISRKAMQHSLGKHVAHRSAYRLAQTCGDLRCRTRLIRFVCECAPFPGACLKAAFTKIALREGESAITIEQLAPIERANIGILNGVHMLQQPCFQIRLCPQGQ